jgi:thiamine biosynthesis lipoprotein ApbE
MENSRRPEKIEDALSRVGYEHLQISGNEVTFQKPGMGSISGHRQRDATDGIVKIPTNMTSLPAFLSPGGGMLRPGEKAGRRRLDGGGQGSGREGRLSGLIPVSEKCVVTSGSTNVFL